MNGLFLGRTLVVGPHRIVPVEDRRVITCRGPAGSWFFAESRLHALVLCDGQLVRCLDASGQDLELSSLLARLPALAAELHRSSPDR